MSPSNARGRGLRRCAKAALRPHNLFRLAALDERIVLRYTMAPMTDKETGSYLRHHLALAGRDDTLFSDDAVTLVYQTSLGYSRAVNTLALQALVDESSTRTAIAEVTAN
jgi:type II secretory pathway predicted ATPase ExeA